MPKNPAGQLSLDALFDTTAISSSLTLDGGGSRLPPEEHDEPVAIVPVRVSKSRAR